METPASVEKILKENRIEQSLTAHLPFSLISKTESRDVVELTFLASKGDLEICKTYRYDASGSVSLSHSITPLNENTWIVLEWNIFALTGAKPYVNSEMIENDRGVYRAQSVEIKDESREFNVLLESGMPWVVCIVPIECVSQSEEGFEKTFQGWSIYFMMQCQDNVPDVVLKVYKSCRS
jgi:hypothetical protein